MSATRWPVDRLVEDVALLGRRAVPRERDSAAVAARPQRVADCDATCRHTLVAGEEP